MQRGGKIANEKTIISTEYNIVTHSNDPELKKQFL